MNSPRPGIFSKNQKGFGQGIITKGNTKTLAEAGTPAEAGEVVVIYCTGLGAVMPAVAAGTAAPASPLSETAEEVTVAIGGQAAEVLFSGLTPGFAGLYQVNVKVPSGVTGGAVPVALTVSGQTSPEVTMAVR